MIKYVLDDTCIDDLTYGSSRKVFVECEDCGKEWITEYRNIHASEGKYCNKCCHKYKKKPILTKESSKSKSNKLKKLLSGRKFSKKWCNKISKSKQRSISEWVDLLIAHPNVKLIDDDLMFKCPICEELFHISKNQKYELSRGINNNKYSMIFHNIDCRKKYLALDKFDTLFEKGFNKGGTSWNKGISTPDEVKKKISEGFNRNLDVHRLAMREAAILRLDELKNQGIINSYPNRGLDEIQCFDQLINNIDYDILINEKIFGYFPDGYIKELNLIIEFDEPHHYKYNDKGIKVLSENDIKRENELRNFLNCKVYRIKQEEWIENSKLIIEELQNIINDIENKLK